MSTSTAIWLGMRSVMQQVGLLGDGFYQ